MTLPDSLRAASDVTWPGVQTCWATNTDSACLILACLLVRTDLFRCLSRNSSIGTSET